jgi:omega-6 fatty acid desaturase (delta-12 desaturase)
MSAAPLDATPTPATRAYKSATELREALTEYCDRSTLLALLLLVLDIALFLVGNWLVIRDQSLVATMGGSVLITTAIVRLFILGHDACHMSLTDHASLNKVLGRVAFLPSLTPYALWRVGHNVVHHGFNNLRGRDFVWQPVDPSEFATFSPARKRLEYVYRSALGPLPYYLIEIWWRKLYYPGKTQAPGQRAEYFWDSTLVTVFAALWISALAWWCPHSTASIARAIGLGFVVPWLAWNWIVGFVIYVHHTHPDTVWYADKASWLKNQGIVHGTVRYRVKPIWNVLLHNIMEHGAHHLDARIPLYRLKAAQAALANMVPQPVVDLSFSTYWRTMKQCKLFDFAEQRWVGFPK